MMETATEPVNDNVDIKEKKKTTVRILLADDHALVAAGLCKLLETDFDLLGAVGDGRALVAAAKKESPDVILLDISMPLLNGVEAARQLRVALPAAKLIFVTVHSDSPYVVEAFRAGASGYLLKRSAASELVTAIREVLLGNLYVTPLIGKSALEGILKVAERRGPLLSLTAKRCPSLAFFMICRSI